MIMHVTLRANLQNRHIGVLTPSVPLTTMLTLTRTARSERVNWTRSEKVRRRMRIIVSTCASIALIVRLFEAHTHTYQQNHFLQVIQNKTH